jgi:16S rRNA (cytosine967-C5)-methyltransferase
MKTSAVVLLLLVRNGTCFSFLPSPGSVFTTSTSRSLHVLHASESQELTSTPPPPHKETNLTPRHLAIQALNPKKKNTDLDAVSRLESTNIFLDSTQRDKAFARNLVSTTSRRMGQIDAVLAQCCATYPPKGKHGGILQACLRVGTAQLLFLDTPAFAAVKETIDVLKDKSFKVPTPMVKFANAVLRRVDREGRGMLEKTDICDNISDFLKVEFRSLYGEENTSKIVEQLLDDNAHRFVDLSPNSRVPADEIIAYFENDEDEKFASVVLLPNGSLRIEKGPNAGAISSWPMYDEGAWWVQDVASTLPAIALTLALERKYGFANILNVVDCCAAPGGKTAQLLSAGFTVTAVEANARRSRRLLENLDRLQFGADHCKVIVAMGQEWSPEEGTEIAGVLVDVPCSATGTGNKRPDVLRKDGDLGNLIETQSMLANHCADNILDSGGIMVYATCSLLKSESEDQVQALLSRGTMKTLPFTKGEICGFDDAIDENGWLRVLPGVLDGELKQCDGFFVARLEKL